MLEWALKSLLKSYLEDYVDGLDTNLDCSKFPVKMHNLTLKEQKMKKQVFKEDHPNSLFMFQNGSIGSVQIELSWSGKAQIIASDVMLNLDFSPMKAVKRLLMPRSAADPNMIGANAFPDAQKAMDNAVPRYCVHHSTPQSRKKVDPRWTECTRCRFKLQTNFAELSLCPVCSQQEIRCMCCGTFAPLPPGAAPVAGAASDSLAGTPSRAGAGGGLSSGGRGPRSQAAERSNSEPVPVTLLDPDMVNHRSSSSRAGSLGPGRGPAGQKVGKNPGLMRAHGEAPAGQKVGQNPGLMPAHGEDPAARHQSREHGPSHVSTPEDPWDDNVSDSGGATRHHAGADDGLGVPQESMPPKPLTMKSNHLKGGRRREPQKMPTRGRSPGPAAKLVTPTPSLELNDSQSLHRVKEPDERIITPREAHEDRMRDSPFGGTDDWFHVPEPEDKNSRVHFGKNEHFAMPSRHQEQGSHTAAGASVFLEEQGHMSHTGAQRAGRPGVTDGWETVPDDFLTAGVGGGKPGPGRANAPTHMMPMNFRNGLMPNAGLGAGSPMHGVSASGRPPSPMQAHGMAASWPPEPEQTHGVVGPPLQARAMQQHRGPPMRDGGVAVSPLQARGMQQHHGSPMRDGGVAASPSQARRMQQNAGGPPVQDWEAVPTDTGTQGHSHHVSQPRRGASGVPNLGAPSAQMHPGRDQDSDRADAGSLGQLERRQNDGRLHAESQPHMHPSFGLSQQQRAWEEDSTGARAGSREDIATTESVGSSAARHTSAGDHDAWQGNPDGEAGSEMQENAGVPVRGYVMDRSSTPQRVAGGPSSRQAAAQAPKSGPDFRLDFYD